MLHFLFSKNLSNHIVVMQHAKNPLQVSCDLTSFLICKAFLIIVVFTTIAIRFSNMFKFCSKSISYLEQPCRHHLHHRQQGSLGLPVDIQTRSSPGYQRVHCFHCCKKKSRSDLRQSVTFLLKSFFEKNNLNFQVRSQV